MFTGIITHLGTFSKRAGDEFIFIIPQKVAKQITASSSIAIDGVCLTVKRKKDKAIYIDVMPETLKKTILGNLKKDDLVNLELPSTPNSLLSGHIVQGHVDGVGKVLDIKKEQNSKILIISFHKALAKYIVTKGSIAINGISLTVVSVKENKFTTAITAYTWKHTIMQNLKRDDLVNIEVDILAKYLEKFLKR